MSKKEYLKEALSNVILPGTYESEGVHLRTISSLLKILTEAFVETLPEESNTKREPPLPINPPQPKALSPRRPIKEYGRQ